MAWPTGLRALLVLGACCGSSGGATPRLDSRLRALHSAVGAGDATGTKRCLSGVVSSLGLPLGMDILATTPGYPADRALRAACDGGNLCTTDPETEELLAELLRELKFGAPTASADGAGPEYILRASAGTEDPRGVRGVNTPPLTKPFKFPRVITVATGTACGSKLAVRGETQRIEPAATT